MRHQVERLKHVALKHGVKPARVLTATLVAVGMMATIAVTSPIPAYNAKAEESTDGKTCTPASVGLGDDISVTGTDTGVATYVGGDMYVGGKPSDANALNNDVGPIGTYAVEAEGLTVVNGSLAMNPQKEAWKLWNTGSAGGKSYVSRGFRWGVVGFGSQFRPADGKTVLAVGGWRQHRHICDAQQSRRLDCSGMAWQDEFLRYH